MSDLKDLRSLFDDAEDDGLGQTSANLLVHNLSATTALGCVGAQADDLNSDDVTLLVLALDMSGSMGGAQQEVIDGFNAMIDALRDSRMADSILASAWVFEDEPKLLFGYTPVQSVPKLTRGLYQPGGSTALYDAALNAFTGIVAYGQDLRNGGIRTRCIVVVFSDGADNASRIRAGDVRQVADDLAGQEIYTLAFVGFGDANAFRQIAQDMGFRNVLTAQHSPSEIRRALGTVSQSVIRASQMTIGPNTSVGFFNPSFNPN